MKRTVVVKQFFSLLFALVWASNLIAQESKGNDDRLELFNDYSGTERVVTFDKTEFSMSRTSIGSSDFRAAGETNLLRIQAENDVPAVSYAVVGYREGASNDYVIGEDVEKLFSPYNYVPEVYTLASNRPVDINFINNTVDLIVPMGIRTGRTGEIRFTFTGMNNYHKASKIEFIDALVGQTIDLTGQPSYTYSFNNTETGIQNERFSLRFGAGELSVVWTPEANTGGTNLQKQDWNNAHNWTPALVPSSSYDVYIPGNCTHYPNLTSGAECNNIYFLHGAELGHPNLLTYKRAHVQLNFGLKQSPQQKKTNWTLFLQNSDASERLQYFAAASGNSLSRERWYMLSSPLRGVVTGDLSFGGFPLTFLMKFDPVKREGQNYSVGNWTTPYNSATESVAQTATNGFAFYIYGDEIAGNNIGCDESGFFGQSNELNFLPTNRSGKYYGIRETNGILELPFFENPTTLNAHRTQVYEPPRSIFYYTSDKTSEFNNLTGTTDQLTREENDGNYRFTPEIFRDDEWVFQSIIYHPGNGLENNTDFLVGNPYMSSIDMIELINDNTATILPQFKIWNNNADRTFSSYSINDNTVISTAPGDVNPNPGYIAPGQGFFLKTRTNFSGSENAVKFDVNLISKVRPYNTPSNLRNGEAEKNILRLKIENKNSASYAVIVYKEGACNDFIDGEDVQKLFSPYENVPEVYSLAGEVPVDINFINDNSEIIVPLGIRTGQKEEIRITVSGMDNYFKSSKIELIDAIENRIVDLTGQSSFTCTFNNTETGIRNGRFSLRIGKSPTALQDITADDLKVYGNSSGLYVVSSASDPVLRVIVYDFQGRKVYESTSDAMYHPLRGYSGHSPVIVKVVTKNRVKTVGLH